MPYRNGRFPARPRARFGMTGFLFIVVPLFIIGFIILSLVNAMHVETITCTVEDKDRTTTRDGQSDARIYTEDCGVLHTQDSLLAWHWSSADTYASIDAGKTYEFTTRGFRIPPLSMFPNVVEVEEVR